MSVQAVEVLARTLAKVLVKEVVWVVVHALAEVIADKNIYRHFFYGVPNLIIRKR